MKSNNILFIIIFLLILTDCNKYNSASNDLSGQNYIRGRVFYVDTLNYDYYVNFLSKVSTYISYNSDSTLNFIYSNQADVNGYYIFNNLQNQNYIVFADTTISGTIYSGLTHVSINNNSSDSTPIYLYPSQTGQNGVVYVISDPADSGFITGASICMFSSQVLASQDTCLGSNYSFTSNGGGHAVQLNIQPHFYYTLIRFQAGNLVLQAMDTITIDTLGIVKRLIKLHT